MCLKRIGLRQQDHELLPAVAGKEIRFTQTVTQCGSDFTQHHVPGGVSVLVIDVLESVDVA